MPDSFKPPLKEHAGDMKNYRHNFGLTLIEILVVAAVIAILIMMVLRVTTRIDSQAKERLTKSTFALINSVLEEFYDYGYQYKNPDYVDFKFPLDFNDLARADFKDLLEEVLDLGPDDVGISGDVFDPNFSGIAGTYFFLNEVPPCREILSEIDGSLITNEHKKDKPLTLNVNGQFYPFYGIVDAWGTALKYDYYDETGDLDDKKETRKAFPVITSAGPDKKFNTTDDISSR